MNYKSYTLLCLIISFCICDDCLPLYWEIDNKYQIDTSQMKTYGRQKPVDCPDQTDKFGGIGNKSDYSVKNIQVLSIEDQSQKIVTVQGNTISAKQVTLNLNISFDAEKSGTPVINPSYKGNGTMNLKQVKVQFSKTLTAVNGIGKYTDVKANKNILNSFSQIVLNPNPTQIKNFLQLINGKVYNAFQDALKIQDFLKQRIANETLQNNFGGLKYNYSFNSISSVVNTAIQKVELIGSKGIKIGYNGNIQNKDCGNVDPASTQTATYITLPFISNLINNYISDSKWADFKLDSKNFQSRLFKFLMVDLQDVLPSALQQYPKLFSPLYAVCTVDSSSSNVFINNGIIVSLKWGCGLFHEESGANLINFNPQIQYTAKLSQIQSTLKVSISNINVNSVQWLPLDNYPLVNESLALIYLQDLISTSLINSETLGTNFKQPQKSKAGFIYNEDVIIIFEQNNDIVI